MATEGPLCKSSYLGTRFNTGVSRVLMEMAAFSGPVFLLYIITAILRRHEDYATWPDSSPAQNRASGEGPNHL